MRSITQNHKRIYMYIGGVHCTRWTFHDSANFLLCTRCHALSYILTNREVEDVRHGWTQRIQKPAAERLFAIQVASRFLAFTRSRSAVFLRNGLGPSETQLTSPDNDGDARGELFYFLVFGRWGKKFLRREEMGVPQFIRCIARLIVEYFLFSFL